MESSAVIGLRTQKTEDNPHGYVNVDSISGDKVCVVCLGGDGTDGNREANGYAKTIENEILDTIDAKVPVYSVAYDFRRWEQPEARELEFNKHRQNVLVSQEEIDRQNAKATEEQINPLYVEKLFNKIILPRISDQDGKGRLSLDEACMRIRKMTIVAHCHGAYVALKLEKKMQETMAKLGYSLEERNKIQSQMLVVAHAPACPLGISKSQFINFISAYDGIRPRGKDLMNAYLSLRVKEERDKGRPDGNAIRPAKENKFHYNDTYRSFDFKPCYFPQHQGNAFMIKQRFLASSYYEYPSEHNDFSYKGEEREGITEDEKMLKRFSSTILKNGIKNSLLQKNGFTPLPPLEKLILGDDEQLNAIGSNLFVKMTENGKAFRRKVCEYALSINNIRKMQKSGRVDLSNYSSVRLPGNLDLSDQTFLPPRQGLLMFGENTKFPPVLDLSQCRGEIIFPENSDLSHCKLIYPPHTTVTYKTGTKMPSEFDFSRCGGDIKFSGDIKFLPEVNLEACKEKIIFAGSNSEGMDLTHTKFVFSKESPIEFWSNINFPQTLDLSQCDGGISFYNNLYGFSDLSDINIIFPKKGDIDLSNATESLPNTLDFSKCRGNIVLPSLLDMTKKKVIFPKKGNLRFSGIVSLPPTLDLRNCHGDITLPKTFDPKKTKLLLPKRGRVLSSGGKVLCQPALRYKLLNYADDLLQKFSGFLPQKSAPAGSLPKQKVSLASIDALLETDFKKILNDNGLRKRRDDLSQRKDKFLRRIFHRQQSNQEERSRVRRALSQKADKLYE